MMEKRFTLDEYYNIEDNYEQKIYHGGEDTDSILDLLNQLNGENEELKQLLREVEHELTSLTGLCAFDKCASQLGYVEVFDDDYWELDYSKMLKKIGKKLKGDV